MKQLISILIVLTIINLYFLIRNTILNNWEWYMVTEGVVIILTFWVFEKYRQNGK